MKILLLVASAFCLTNPVIGTTVESLSGMQPKIFGGVPAMPHDIQSIVAILRRGEYYCSGSIINSEPAAPAALKWILTSARCALHPAYDYDVRTGEHNLDVDDGDDEDFRVKQIIIHPQFNSSTLQNDIALMELSGSFGGDPGKRFPITLGSTIPTEVAVVAGWGSTVVTDPKPNPTLKKADVTILSEAECTTKHDPGTFLPGMICANPTNGDICNGDYGAPLMQPNTTPTTAATTLVGVASWGYGCGSTLYPSVYTGISEAIRTWILANAKP